MKPTSLRKSTLPLVWIALIAFGLPYINTSASAAYFSNSDTKRSHPRPSPSWVDYARFEWLSSDEIQPNAVVNRIVVSLADQRLYAYHDQLLLAWSNVSSGRPGHETPTGAFNVSEKDIEHHSSIYDNASMPFFMRLTDSGVGMHAGFLPGYPASHGCVRLPLGMASELYQRVEAGTPVNIISDPVKPDVAEKTQPALHLAQG